MARLITHSSDNSIQWELLLESYTKIFLLFTQLLKASSSSNSDEHQKEESKEPDYGEDKSSQKKGKRRAHEK